MFPQSSFEEPPRRTETLKWTAAFIAAIVGVLASGTYMVLTTPRVPAAAQVEDQNPFSARNRSTIEGIAILFSTAAGIGWLVYRVFGSREEAEIVKEEIGSYALFLQGLAILLLGGPVIFALIQQDPIVKRDIVAVIFAGALFVLAVTEWCFRS